MPVTALALLVLGDCYWRGELPFTAAYLYAATLRWVPVALLVVVSAKIYLCSLVVIACSLNLFDRCCAHLTLVPVTLTLLIPSLVEFLPSYGSLNNVHC